MTTQPIDPKKLTFVWDSQAAGRFQCEGCPPIPRDLADYFAFLEEAAPANDTHPRLPQHTPDSVFSLEETVS